MRSFEFFPRCGHQVSGQRDQTNRTHIATYPLESMRRVSHRGIVALGQGSADLPYIAPDIVAGFEQQVGKELGPAADLLQFLDDARVDRTGDDGSQDRSRLARTRVHRRCRIGYIEYRARIGHLSEIADRHAQPGQGDRLVHHAHCAALAQADRGLLGRIGSEEHGRSRIDTAETVGLQQAYAVHVAEIVVEQQQIEVLLGKRVERGHAAGAGGYLMTVADKQFVQQHEIGFIVFGDQDAQSVRITRRWRRWRGIERFLDRCAARQVDLEPEPAALAGLAFEQQLAAHQFDDLPGKGEAQSGSPEAATRALIDLRERLENRPMERFGNADAGIFDAEAQSVFERRFLEQVDGDVDLAAFGELDRIASQVEQDPPEVMRVGFYPVGDGRVERDTEGRALLGGARCKRVVHHLHFFGQIERGRLELRGARPELGHVEQLVDFTQQLVRQGEDGVGPARHRFIADLGGQQFGRGDDAGQWGAQFMADLGQQRRFGLTLALGVFARLSQGLDQDPGVHRHNHQRKHQGDPHGRIGLPVRHTEKDQQETRNRGQLAQVHERPARAEAEAENREQVEADHDAAVLAHHDQPGRQRQRIEYRRGHKQVVGRHRLAIVDQHVHGDHIGAVAQGQCEQPACDTLGGGQIEVGLDEHDRHGDNDAHPGLRGKDRPQAGLGLVESAFNDIWDHGRPPAKDMLKFASLYGKRHKSMV